MKDENPLYINTGQENPTEIESPTILGAVRSTDVSRSTDISTLIPDPDSSLIEPSTHILDTTNTWYSYGDGERFDSDGTVKQYVYTTLTVPNGYTATVVLYAYTEANYDGIILCASGKTITSATSIRNCASYAYTGVVSTSSASGNGTSTTISNIPAGTYKIYYISDVSNSSNGDYVYYTVSKTATSSGGSSSGSSTTFSCTVSVASVSSSYGINAQLKLNSGSWTTGSVTATSYSDKVYIKVNDATSSASYAKYKAVSWGISTVNSMNSPTTSGTSYLDGTGYITGFTKNSSSSGSPAIILKVNVSTGTEASTGIGGYYVTAGTVTDNRTAAGGSVTVTAGSAYHTTTYYWKFSDNTYRGPFNGDNVADDTSVAIVGTRLTQTGPLTASHSSMGTSIASDSGNVVWFNKSNTSKTASINLSAISNSITGGSWSGSLSLSCSDIPAAGGSVSTSSCTASKNLSYTVTFTSGSTAAASVSYGSISGSTVSSSSTYSSRTLIKSNAFSITATATYNSTTQDTYTAYASAYQAAQTTTWGPIVVTTSPILSSYTASAAGETVTVSTITNSSPYVRQSYKNSGDDSSSWVTLSSSNWTISGNSITASYLGCTETSQTTLGSFTCNITGNDGKTASRTCTVYQQANTYEYGPFETSTGSTSVTLTVTCPNVPAAGGSVTTTDDAVITTNIKQYKYYTSGCKSEVSLSQSIYGKTYSGISTTTFRADVNYSESKVTLGTITVTVTGQDNRSKTAYCTVYQSANSITSVEYGEILGELSISCSSAYIKAPASGGTYYASDCGIVKNCYQKVTTSYASGHTIDSSDYSVITYTLSGKQSSSSIDAGYVVDSLKNTVKSAGYTLNLNNGYALFGITATGKNDKSKSVNSGWGAAAEIWQEANYITEYGDVFGANNIDIIVPVIPAAGGSVSPSDCTTRYYAEWQPITYASGYVDRVNPTYVITGSTVSAGSKQDVISEKTTVQTSAFVLRLDGLGGKSDTATHGYDVYQAANKVESSTVSKSGSYLNVSIPDIPASGGTVSCSDITYTSDYDASINYTYTSGYSKSVATTINYTVQGGPNNTTDWSYSVNKLPAADSDRTSVYANAFTVQALAGSDNTLIASTTGNLYQAANYVTNYGDITGTLSISSPNDIPAAGGSRTATECASVKNCSQTVTYLSTSTRSGSISYSVSPATISADTLGNTSASRSAVGTFTITATGEGSKTKTASCAVYQGENKVENSDYNSSNYDYTIAPGSINSSLSASGGSLSWTAGSANHTHKYYYLYTSGSTSGPYTRTVSDNVKESLLIICDQETSLIEDSSGASSGTFSRFTYNKSGRTATHSSMSTNECTDGLSVIWINAGSGSSVNDSGVVTGSDSANVVNKAESLIVTLNPNLIKRTTATYDGGTSAISTTATFTSGVSSLMSPSVLTYTVSNSDIATVSAAGIITGIGVGTTEIWVTYKSSHSNTSGYAGLTVENGIVLYLKSNGLWVPVTSVYKKVNGGWVLQNNDDFASIFGTVDNLPAWVDK